MCQPQKLQRPPPSRRLLFAAPAEHEKKLNAHALATQSKQRIDGALDLVKAHLEVSPEEFDQDPMVLNVENGTVDLKTGELRPHSREDLITKMAPVKFDAKAKSPGFQKFLRQVLVDDATIEFVQRFLGYSLTGSVEERAMAVLHGVGKNGKSTLVELFQDLLGDYSTAIATQTLMNTWYSDVTAQYQLAVLNGVRFISAAETKRGQELDETGVKHITGGDTITARAPYGQFFTYRPQFKLWMSTNHKPEIPDGSEAIWDRLRLIPFTQRFDGKRADRDLPEKLREELPGVLAWAVRGCVEWNANGLGTSKAVEKATAEYRSETDVLDRFFEDECEFGPDFRIEKRALFEAWSRWCDQEGVDAGTQTTFTRTVKERGITRGFSEKKVMGTRMWVGVRVVIPPSDPQSAPTQKSWKHIGISDSKGHFPPNSENFSPGALRGDKSGETPSEVPLVPLEKNIPLTVEGYEVVDVDCSEKS